MNRTEVMTEIVAEWPEPGDVVYIERRGDSYAVKRVGADGALPVPAPGDALPDAWIYYSGWQEHHRDDLPAFFDDLFAEMDSAAGGLDRCRWSADDPWPHAH
ncbi:MAG: hypothetical protein ACRDTX_01675 [Pseudonocardiaceae bacterium]